MRRRPAPPSIALALLMAGCAAASPAGPTAAEIGTPSSRLSTPRPDASATPRSAAYVPGPADGGSGPDAASPGRPPGEGAPTVAPSPAPAATASLGGQAALPPAPTPSPWPSGRATLPPISPWGTPTPGPSASATPVASSPPPTATPMPSPSTRPNGSAGTAVGAGVVLDMSDSLQFNLALQDRGNPGTMTGFAVIDGVGLRITCTPTVVVIAGGQVKASGKARVNGMDGTFTVDIRDGAPDHLAATFAAAGKAYDLAGDVQRGDITVTPAP